MQRAGLEQAMWRMELEWFLPCSMTGLHPVLACGQSCTVPVWPQEIRVLLAARCHWHSEEKAAELVTSAVVHFMGDQLHSAQVELISAL